VGGKHPPEDGLLSWVRCLVRVSILSSPTEEINHEQDESTEEVVYNWQTKLFTQFSCGLSVT
jgi:hypothetical protein